MKKVILTLLLIAGVLGFFVSQKEGYHMDELLSYELSNAAYNPWIVPTQPEGRLAKFMRCEIQGENLGETLKNLGNTAADVLKNRGGSVLANYKADVYEEPVWIGAQQFRDYITVNRDDAFQYLSVYFNVKDDNHPPLHFMLLHTVSSIFQGKIKPFMGCAINIAAILATCLLIIAMGRMGEGTGIPLWNSKTGLLAALLYGLSSGAVATALLTRMYGLMTFFCVALLAIHVKKWRDKSFDVKNGWLIAVTVLGFLTQYFFLFYCLTLALATAVGLARGKMWKQLWRYIRAMVTAAVIGLACFPFAVSDVFSSGRGVEALEGLKSGLGGYGARLAAFGGILLERMFGSVQGGVVILLLLSGSVLLALALRGEKSGADSGVSAEDRELPAENRQVPVKECEVSAEERKAPAENRQVSVKECEVSAEGREVSAEKRKASVGDRVAFAGDNREALEERAGKSLGWLALLILPPVVYFLLAARMSPYLVDRYVMAVFPFGAMLLALFISGAVGLVWGRPAGNAQRGAAGKRPVEYALSFALAGMLCVINVATYDGEYLYRGYGAQEAVAEEYAELPCICVYDGVGYYENLLEFAKYDKTLLLTSGELENRRDTESITDLEKMVVLVKGNVDADNVQRVLANQYGMEPVRELIGSSVYGDGLWLYARAE